MSEFLFHHPPFNCPFGQSASLSTHSTFQTILQTNSSTCLVCHLSLPSCLLKFPLFYKNLHCPITTTTTLLLTSCMKLHPAKGLYFCELPGNLNTVKGTKRKHPVHAKTDTGVQCRYDAAHGYVRCYQIVCHMSEEIRDRR